MNVFAFLVHNRTNGKVKKIYKSGAFCPPRLQCITHMIRILLRSSVKASTARDRKASYRSSGNSKLELSQLLQRAYTVSILLTGE